MARIKNDMVKGTKGKVGKDLMYKTRKGKTFLCKIPDMSEVVATETQTKNRNIFGEAVKFARQLLQDPVRSAAFKLKKDEVLYLAAIQEYMRMHGVRKAGKDFNSTYWFRKLEGAGLSDRQANAALFIMKTGFLTNNDCQEMNGISKATATRDLQLLVDNRIIESNGIKGAGAAYKMGSWWKEIGS